MLGTWRRYSCLEVSRPAIPRRQLLIMASANAQANDVAHTVKVSARQGSRCASELPHSTAAAPIRMAGTPPQPTWAVPPAEDRRGVGDPLCQVRRGHLDQRRDDTQVQIRDDERRDQQEHADADGNRFLAPDAHRSQAYGLVDALTATPVVWHSPRVSAQPAVAPAGVVTFPSVVTAEGSTRRWEDDASAMRSALAEHDEVLRRAISAHGGYLFKHTGDGVCAAFASPKSAGTPRLPRSGNWSCRYAWVLRPAKLSFAFRTTRHGAQSCGAGDGRRPRRPGPGGRFDRAAAHWSRACRSGPAPIARPARADRRLPGSCTRPALGVPAAAYADPARRQHSTAGVDLHRSRSRASEGC